MRSRACNQAGASVLANIGFALIGFVLLLAALSIGYMHYQLSKTIRERPELSLQPVPLPPAPPLDASGAPLNCAQVIEFAAPWGKPEDDNCAWSKGDTYLFIRWPDGREIRFGRPETVIDLFAREELRFPDDTSWIDECFGGQTDTRYEAMARILNRVPQRPSFVAVPQLFCELLVIQWKESVLGPEPTAIYSFENTAGRGFQVGDPAHSREVRVHFYDKENDHHHCLVFIAQPNAPAITQSELDFILRSLRYVEEKRPPTG